jgi:diguanylate cyclase (GGDEF)-like protein
MRKAIAPTPPLSRSNRVTEIVRQWILLIPLTTAIAGSALVQTVANYPQLLPPIFFAGALLVTTAMFYQRQLLRSNQQLTGRLQAANERLDTLHRLSVELNQTLRAAEVGDTVLQHSKLLLAADSAAIWLFDAELGTESMRQFVESAVAGDGDGTAVGPEQPEHQTWTCIAQSGFEKADRRGELRTLEDRVRRALSDGFAADANGVADDSKMRRQLLFKDARAFAVSITWQGGKGAVILLKNWTRSFTDEEIVVLDDVALMAGPVLQNALLYQATAERAEIDGLTKLYNHRALQERIVQEVARVQRNRSSHATPRKTMALAMMDITDFKLFNDTYGHAVGDAVLRTVSECLRHTFRVSDIVARFGGDEFVVMLPDTGCAGAEVICARAVHNVGARPFVAPDGSRIAIRLTCGVAVFPDDGESAADLLKVADARLYVAKRQGELIIESNDDGNVPEVLITKPAWNSIGLLEALVTAIDNKDRYTRQHSEDVWRYALLTAHEMALGQEVLQAVSIASLVMDVGKIVVPDSILRKPGRLSDAEMEMMQQHPVFSAMIVKDVPHLELVLGGIRHHHERYDGKGYPDGLAGDKIPFVGRLLAVADGYTAMTAERPYRKALTQEQALTEIRNERGQQYDPDIAEAFVEMMCRAREEDASLQEALRSGDVSHRAV